MNVEAFGQFYVRNVFRWEAERAFASFAVKMYVFIADVVVRVIAVVSVFAKCVFSLSGAVVDLMYEVMFRQ